MTLLLGEMLVKKGVVSEKHVCQAFDKQQTCTKKLGEILIEMGHLDTKTLTQVLQEQAAVPLKYRRGHFRDWMYMP